MFIDREELYQLAWKEPMAKLCHKFGITDVALKKHCKRLKIPTPYRGYWARLEAGQKPPITKLTPLTASGQTGVESYDPSRGSPPPTKHSETDAEEIQTKNRIQRFLISPKNPQALQARFVTSTRAILSGGRPDDYGRVCPHGPGCLDVNVSPRVLNRSLRLIGAVIKTLESMDYNVTTGEPQSKSGYAWDSNRAVTNAVRDGVSVNIRLDERCRETRRPPTPDEVKSSPWRYDISRSLDKTPRSVLERTPTGELRLTIGGSFGGRVFKDGKQTLEHQLTAAIFAVDQAREDLLRRQQLYAQEKRERELREAARQREELLFHHEEIRRLDLHNKMNALAESTRIREFMLAARAALERRHGAMEPGDEAERWLSWLASVAEEIDPLTTSDSDAQWPPPAGFVPPGARRMKAMTSAYWATEVPHSDEIVLPPNDDDEISESDTKTDFPDE